MVLKNNSQCPECSGYLKVRHDMTLKCVDCGSVFVPVGDGIAETELEYIRVPKKHKEEDYLKVR